MVNNLDYKKYLQETPNGLPVQAAFLVPPAYMYCNLKLKQCPDGMPDPVDVRIRLIIPCKPQQPCHLGRLLTSYRDIIYK